MKITRYYYLEELPQILLVIILAFVLRYYFIILLVTLLLIFEFIFFEFKEVIILESENLIIIKKYLLKKKKFCLDYKKIDILILNSSKMSLDNFLGLTYYFLIKEDDEKVMVFRKFIENDKLFFKKNKRDEFLKNLQIYKKKCENTGSKKMDRLH